MSQVHRHRRKKVKGKLSGKTRFRALVRAVIENRPWLEEAHMAKGMDDDIKKNVRLIDLATRKKYQSLSLAMLFEINSGARSPLYWLERAYTYTKQSIISYSKRPKLNKSLLRKDARLRTEEDIETLYKVIGNLKCFRRYPENVRKELVGTTYFVYYGPGRVIVRQDHESTCLGFVLWGGLEVSQSRLDPVFGTRVTEVTAQLVPGSVFGDVSLLHGIPRTATVTSLTAVELLILKKDDFDRVLKASLQKQWDEISAALQQFPYFDSWGDVARRECCMLSDTASFSAHDIVLGRGHGKQTYAHFVLSGSCAMLQTLMVTRVGDDFRLHPSLPPGTSVQQARGSSVVQSSDTAGLLHPRPEPLFMQVCVFNQGGCFNLGESLASRTIVAAGDVTVLRVPLYLLRQHSVANIWQRIRQFLESRLATERQLFQRFREARRWERYKRRLCASLRNPRTLNDTSVHDAPYYWRVQGLELNEREEYK